MRVELYGRCEIDGTVHEMAVCGVFNTFTVLLRLLMDDDNASRSVRWGHVSSMKAVGRGRRKGGAGGR